MAVSSIAGPYTQEGRRDKDGHREYDVSHIIETTSSLDGPSVIMSYLGLPQIGDVWNFGNDLDSWAFCYPDMTVTPHETDHETTYFWKVSQKFSTKPLNRCQDTQIENPIDEPVKVSGSFVQYRKEAAFDRFGNYLRNSGWEQIRGADAEFDAHRASVKIEHNTLFLELDVFTEMMNTVNDAPLWGLPVRCIKLSNVSWDRKYYGLCNVYYTRSFEFDIDFDTFDRYVLDDGTMVLNGDWEGGEWVVKNFEDGTVPDPDNPRHFEIFQDVKGEVRPIIYDSENIGEPWDPNGSGSPNQLFISYYPESNFLLLGVPTIL